jgi:hypothetical protein
VFYKLFRQFARIHAAQSAITFIVSTTLSLLAAKWSSASHLRCVKAAKRPKGLALTRTNITLLVCGATPTLAVCTAWPTQAIHPRSGSRFTNIYERNKAFPPASTAQHATEFIVNTSLIAAFVADWNHSANPAQAVPALAREARAQLLNDRQSAMPLDAAQAAHSRCRAEGRETPWGADGLPRRWLAAIAAAPSWVGGGTLVASCAQRTDQNTCWRRNARPH